MVLPMLRFKRIDCSTAKDEQTKLSSLVEYVQREMKANACYCYTRCSALASLNLHNENVVIAQRKSGTRPLA